MFSGVLRSIIQPVSRTILSPRSPFIFPITSSPSPACDRHFCHLLLSPFLGNVRGIPASNAFHSASLRPAAEEQLVLKQPNEGSVRRRDEKKNQIKKHRAFVLAEKKKLKARVEACRRELEHWDWDERGMEKFWSDQFARQIKRKEAFPDGRVYTPSYNELRREFRREFEEDKKKDAAVAAMSWGSWVQWRRTHKLNPVQASVEVHAHDVERINPVQGSVEAHAHDVVNRGFTASNAFYSASSLRPAVLKQPNQDSVRRRDEKNRTKQHRAFVLSERKKIEEKRKEAKRNKERLQHENWKNHMKLRRVFEEDKKKHAAVAAMSWGRWMQWRWIQKERGAEAKLKINQAH